MKTPILVPALIIGASLSLTGCISFGAKPPPHLLTLEAASAPAVGAQRDSATAKSIVVKVPTIPASLATARIPVQESPTTIAYVPDALWSEPPANLFARLLADTLTAQTGMVVLSSIESIGDPSASLAGELRAFGIDATTREAVVTYDAALSRAGGTSVEKRRFEARVPVAAIDAATSAPALNQAANRVAGEVATWVAAGR
ncbi:MAG: ABC-type transport auxiliary lipoprotein family protein [Pseudomonadota bacterium]|nr:ABC-type transport auxiliary lipoprotein family protein [Pseudomonadota bacterium]